VAHASGTERRDDLHRRRAPLAGNAVQAADQIPTGGIDVVDQHQRRLTGGGVAQQLQQVVRRGRPGRFRLDLRATAGRRDDEPVPQDRLGAQPAQRAALAATGGAGQPDDTRPMRGIQEIPQSTQVLLAAGWRVGSQARRATHRRVPREGRAAGAVQAGQRLRRAGWPASRIGRQQLLEPLRESGRMPLGQRRSLAPALADPLDEGRQVGAVRQEGRSVVHHLVQQRAQTVQIGSAPRRRAVEQLGRHVGQRARRGRARALLLAARGEPQVEQHQTAAQARTAPHQQVLRLQVAVDQAEVVQEAQHPQGFGHQPEQPLGRRGLQQAVALDVLQREARRAVDGRPVEIVGLDQSGMAQPGKEDELAAQGLRMLDRHGFLQRETRARAQPIQDQPDLARAPFPEQFEALIPVGNRLRLGHAVTI
jgi:hypothetical protein